MDFLDQASTESYNDIVFHLKERENKYLYKIKEALQRIADGSFGICEECGEEISEERLKARPITSLCIACKKKQEAEEKLRGL